MPLAENLVDDRAIGLIELTVLPEGLRNANRYLPHRFKTRRTLEPLQAALRHELGGDHTFDFVEGVVPHPKAPGMRDPSSFQQEHQLKHILRD